MLSIQYRLWANLLYFQVPNPLVVERRGPLLSSRCCDHHIVIQRSFPWLRLKELTFNVWLPSRRTWDKIPKIIDQMATLEVTIWWSKIYEGLNWEIRLCQQHWMIRTIINVSSINCQPSTGRSQHALISCFVLQSIDDRWSETSDQLLPSW